MFMQMYSKYPRLLVTPAALLLVLIIGYADYVTGDYSMLIFYLVPIAVGGWFAGRTGGVVVAVASECARVLSDSSTYVAFAPVRLWNTIQEGVFLIVVGLLVAVLRKVLCRSESDTD